MSACPTLARVLAHWRSHTRSRLEQRSLKERLRASARETAAAVESNLSKEPAPVLAVTRQAAQIASRVETHRVTLIMGPTGCGKSTQVPKILLAALRTKRILCVQPRRLGVIAVATRVAKELDTMLGGDLVGYHIGAAKEALLDHTKLMFVTAGIFLELVKSHGSGALNRFGAVIVDEVHERSTENDLALACLTQLVLAARELRTLKVVFMSATPDLARYQPRLLVYLPPACVMCTCYCSA